MYKTSLLIFYVFIFIFLTSSVQSMYKGSDMYTIIMPEDGAYDKEQLIAIRRYNARVIQQNIEVVNDFYEGCSKVFCFLKNIFYCNCNNHNDYSNNR